MKKLVLALSGLLLWPAGALASGAQPPWAGECPPTALSSYNFTVPAVDNVPDLHGDPLHAELVLFVGGNQFMVMSELVAAFVKHQPSLAGRIFYETLPPGILAQQMAHENALTIGCLTLQLQPDVYEAGALKVDALVKQGLAKDAVRYATNDLTLMVQKGNPLHIRGLKDLGRPGLRVAMPNPAWEGVARQIIASYRKVGGEGLVKNILQTKLQRGETLLTQIHHRQTPMWLMDGKADAGVTWRSEARYQEMIGNPIADVPIPSAENTVATYAAARLVKAAHPAAAIAWLQFLGSAEAHDVYARYGFQSVPTLHK
jgi:ABC-type molybdate transport system substrate-binding protein